MALGFYAGYSAMAKHTKANAIGYYSTANCDECMVLGDGT